MEAPIPRSSQDSPIPRLVFVVCPSFHGATLLALLLNNHPEVTALADTNPTRAFEQTCACGKKLGACSFWQAISRRLDSDRFAELGSLFPELPWPLSQRNHLEDAHVAVSRNPTINRVTGHAVAAVADAVLPVIWRRRSVVAEYLDVWEDFYRTVTQLHGTSVFVDGSKSTRKAALIASHLANDVDIRVIHLVRDPRGFAVSARRVHSEASIRSVTWTWADLHRRMERLQRALPYLRVRYEDLAAHPQTEMASVLRFLNLDQEAVVGPPRFPEKHHLIGNAMLFRFDGTIAANESWRKVLSGADQRLVLRYAGRPARRHGYA